LSGHQTPFDNNLASQEIAPQSASSAVNGAGVDMQDYDGVAFLIEAGDIASGTTLNAKAQRDTASNFPSAVDIPGAAITQLGDTDDNKLVVIDVYAPTERYIRCVVTPAVSTALICVTAVRYRKTGELPVTQAAAEYIKVRDS